MKYCKNCKQNVEPEKHNGKLAIVSFIIFLSTWLFSGSLIWGIIISITALFVLTISLEADCPICKATNFSSAKKERKSA